MKTYYSKTAALLTSVAVLAGSLFATANAASSKTAPPTLMGTVDPVSGFLITNGVVDGYIQVDGTYIRTPTGTSAYSAYITVNGVSRRYVVVRPTSLTSKAPVMLLLHPNSTLPENMANLTGAGDFALTQGFWAVMPQAIGMKWMEDPSTSGDDDVQFISALIDSLIKQGADGTRIYAGGFSSGGFMTERLACELSNKIAAFGIDAAELRGSLQSTCSPTRQRSKIYFLGTADGIVPYDGVYSGTANGLWSAADTLNYWVGKQKCGGVIANSVPNRVSDGTSVQQTEYTGCTSGNTLQLYTITGGGHAWSGSQSYAIDTTSQNIMTTGLMWDFVKAYRR